MEGCTILIVDDDASLLGALRRRARGLRDVRVVTAERSEPALRLAVSERPDIAIVDLLLDGQSGVELIARIKQLRPAMKIAAVTGAASKEIVEAAKAAGAIACLTKPYTIAEAAKAIDVEHEALQAASLTEHATLARAMWQHVHRVHADCDGNLSRTASILGISVNTLKKQLAKPSP